MGLLGPGALVPPDPWSCPAGWLLPLDGAAVPADDGVPVPALDGVPADGEAPPAADPPVTAPALSFFFFFFVPAEAGISLPVDGVACTGGSTRCELLSLPPDEIATIRTISSTRPPSATARRRQ